jgi:hypothetical protein
MGERAGSILSKEKNGRRSEEELFQGKEVPKLLEDRGIDAHV